jgi:hypothetical protein
MLKASDTAVVEELSVMSKRKLEIVQARRSRGEELRLTFMLAALKASRPLKLTGRKAGARRAALSSEPLAA